MRNTNNAWTVRKVAKRFKYIRLMIAYPGRNLDDDDSRSDKGEWLDDESISRIPHDLSTNRYPNQTYYKSRIWEVGPGGMMVYNDPYIKNKVQEIYSLIETFHRAPC